jgi:cystathionine beta-lyase/cystathionine gamma-synthase
MYNRCSSGALNNLEASLLQRYAGAKDAIVTSSGMAAVYAAVEAVLCQCISTRGRRGVNVVCSNELFKVTPNVIKHLLKQHKQQPNQTNQAQSAAAAAPVRTDEAPIIMHRIDVSDAAAVGALFAKRQLKGQVNVFFLETCTNPNGRMLDWSLLPALAAQSHELHLVLDNTWLSSSVFNPFVDCPAATALSSCTVLASLTKHYSGGTHIGGVVVTAHEGLARAVRATQKLRGVHVSPLAAQLINSHLPTLDARCVRMSRVVCDVLDYFTADHQSGRLRLVHPYMADHPSHDVYQRLQRQRALSPSLPLLLLYPSVFVMCVRAAKTQVMDALRSNPFIEFKTSFGGATHRFDPWPVVTHFSDNRGGASAAAAPATPLVHIRIAIGYKQLGTDVVHGIEALLTRLAI